ncbi:MAG: type II toxin-antitoxin system prevent-host-death family antitoxin [Gemmatimonadaceae bacterium]
MTNFLTQTRLTSMTRIVKLYEAKTHLSDMVERAAAGEEFIIAKGSVPKARLVPFSATRGARAAGGWEGRLWIAEDFDAPLPPEISGAFQGEE